MKKTNEGDGGMSFLAYFRKNKIKRSIIHVDISIKNAIANKFFTFFLSPRDICHQLFFLLRHSEQRQHRKQWKFHSYVTLNYSICYVDTMREIKALRMIRKILFSMREKPFSFHGFFFLRFFPGCKSLAI